VCSSDLSAMPKADDHLSQKIDGLSRLLFATTTDAIQK
jgi:hypothetical protein